AGTADEGLRPGAPRQAVCGITPVRQPVGVANRHSPRPSRPLAQLNLVFRRGTPPPISSILDAGQARTAQVDFCFRFPAYPSEASLLATVVSGSLRGCGVTECQKKR